MKGYKKITSPILVRLGAAWKCLFSSEFIFIKITRLVENDENWRVINVSTRTNGDRPDDCLSIRAALELKSEGLTKEDFE